MPAAIDAHYQFGPNQQLAARIPFRKQILPRLSTGYARCRGTSSTVFSFVFTTSPERPTTILTKALDQQTAKIHSLFSFVRGTRTPNIALQISRGGLISPSASGPKGAPNRRRLLAIFYPRSLNRLERKVQLCSRRAAMSLPRTHRISGALDKAVPSGTSLGSYVTPSSRLPSWYLVNSGSGALPPMAKV